MSVKFKSNLIKISIVAVLVLAIALFLFGFRLKKQQIHNVSELIPFSEEGFVDGNLLSNENRLAAENERFELYLNENNTHFKVRDKMTQEVIQSNPGIEDIRPSELTKTKSLTMQYTYVNKKGSQKNDNNYDLSIYHERTALNPEGYKTFKIKYLEDGFQIYYHLEKIGINYLYFPKYIPRDRMEQFPANEKRLLEQYYRIQDDLYQFSDSEYEGMRGVLRDTLYEVFYDEEGEPKYEYDIEYNIELNASYGYYKAELDDAIFEIAVQVNLTDKGFETAILRDSIKESEGYRLTNINIYPYIGSAVSEIDGKPAEGYIVIPDGSGAIIEFKPLSRANISPYRERVYGRDLSLLPFEKPEDKEVISIPLFGMVKDNIGFAGIIKKGDTQAFINADVAGRSDDYYKVYPSYLLRENEIALIGTAYTNKEMNLWTADIVPTDFVVEYIVLTNNQNNYVGVAEAYRNYLIETYGFEKTEQSNQPIVTLELLGAYDQKGYFLGVPYDQVRSLTTFNQAQEIIGELNEHIDLNVLYKGAINGGLKSSFQTTVKYESVLGGKKDFKKLQEELNRIDSNLFLEVAVTQTSKYRRPFDHFSYSAQRLDGSHSRVHTYHLPTGLAYRLLNYDHSPDDYVINPKYYESIFKKTDKKLLESDLSFTNLGTRLAGHYSKKDVVYRVEALKIQEELLNSVDQKLMLANPMGFAYANANYIVDLPVTSTLYPIISYSIPLLQLILNGYIDYSSQSINLMLSRSEEYNFLKILETGSNLKYTITYDNPNKLIDTEYNMYLSTYYGDWKDKLIDHYNELVAIGFHNYRLVDHQRIQNNVIKVSYGDNSTVALEIYINYNLTDVVIDGILVESLSYTIV